MLSVALAVVDAAVGVDLIQYALPRERRDKDAVLAAGVFLLRCAGDRVDASYRTVDGNHLAWVPAADVERTSISQAARGRLRLHLSVCAQARPTVPYADL